MPVATSLPGPGEPREGRIAIPFAGVRASTPGARCCVVGDQFEAATGRNGNEHEGVCRPPPTRVPGPGRPRRRPRRCPPLPIAIVHLPRARDWHGLGCLALVTAVSALMLYGTLVGWWAPRW